jgi:hypothetical protein
MKILTSTALLTVALSTLFLLGGCTDEAGDSGSGGGSSSLSLIIRGSNLGTAASARTAASTSSSDPVACKGFFVLGDQGDSSQCGGSSPCYPDAGARQGSCLTPLSITGKATRLDLAGSSMGDGLRLLGSGEGGGKDDVYLLGDAFDIQDPLSLSGEDNAQDHSSFESKHTHIALNFDYLDVKVAAPRTSGTEYWTIRYIFKSLPFTDETNHSCTTTCSDPEELNCTTTCTATGETIGQCLDRLQRPGAADAADLVAASYYGGLSGVKRGDVLLCKKTSASATCASSDWEWLDNSSGSLVPNRPSSDSDVYSFAHLADYKPVCKEPTGGGPGVQLELGGWGFKAKLYEPIKFNAQFNGSLKVYKFENQAGVQEGSDLDMYVDIDVHKSVLLYDEENQGQTDLTFANLGSGYSTLTGLSDAALLKMISYKPIFAYENSGCDPWKPGSCEMIPSGLKANLRVTLSGATEPEVYDCESEQGASSTECVGNEDPGTY